jgi:hypothetical protein
MLLVVGLLILLPSGGCTMPFLVLTLQNIWLRGFDFGDLSGANGALAGLFLFMMLIGIGVMALGAWLVYLALPRRG